ncbi:MAG TPA: hypothetical protein VFQ61_33165 [Polyangiaceae bacterium]|nr:hypothetical protein [Polyangiaceae bacterium]
MATTLRCPFGIATGGVAGAAEPEATGAPLALGAAGDADGAALLTAAGSAAGVVAGAGVLGGGVVGVALVSGLTRLSGSGGVVDRHCVSSGKANASKT